MGRGFGLVGCAFGSSTSLRHLLGKLDVRNSPRAVQKAGNGVQLYVLLYWIHLKNCFLDCIKSFFDIGIRLKMGTRMGLYIK
jgi:hypothetical protein